MAALYIIIITHLLIKWACRTAVKNWEYGHLFTVTGNILLAPTWQIANRAQLSYTFLILPATLHSGVGDTACTNKTFAIFFSISKERKEKPQIMLFEINSANKNEYSHQDLRQLYTQLCVKWAFSFPTAFYVIFLHGTCLQLYGHVEHYLGNDF